MDKKLHHSTEIIEGGEFKEFINNFLNYVQNEYVSKHTISKYTSLIHKFERYCKQNNITTPFADNIFSNYFENFRKSYSNSYFQYTFRVLNKFRDFSLSRPLKKVYLNNIYTFSSFDFTNILSQFYTFLGSCEIRDTTKMRYYKDVRTFLRYLESQKIYSFCNFSVDYIFNYINSSNLAHATKYGYSKTLRKFFDFTFNQMITSFSGKQIFPKLKRNSNERILSFYTPAEISSLLTVIDTSTPLGKRNYAIILLAAILGFRAGDIVNLKFDNMDWDNKLINITQQKTDKELTQPFTDEIFFAILDYWKNARPTTNFSNIFITHTRPFTPLSAPALSAITTKYFKLAKIDISRRKHGIHSLRHSLANNMLHNKVSFQDISASLGHSYLSTTTMYVNIDISTLKLLSLEV